jgi:hypothetical protein
MTKSTMASTSSFVVGGFDGHGSQPVQYKVHHPMQHVQGYSGSHWMPASGNYLLRIAPMAARVIGKQTTIYKYTYKAGPFDGNGNAPALNRMHCPMEEVQGFTRSHRMPPSVVSCLDMYRTNVLMYRTMVLLVRPTKGQMLDM